jgi:hypothetical protein
MADLPGKRSLAKRARCHAEEACRFDQVQPTSERLRLYTQSERHILERPNL